MTPKQIIEAIKAERPEINTLFFVGCGASSAEQYPAQYFMDCNARKIRTSFYTANEFNYATPVSLDETAIVIACSLGGTTPETVAAAKLSQEKGAKVIAVTHDGNSPLAKNADYVIVHGFEKDYAAKLEKMNNILMLAVEVLNQYEGYDHYEDMVKGSENIYAAIEDAVSYSLTPAKAFAEAYKDSPVIYVMSSGATQKVAYSFSICLLMEMQWINSGSFHDGEFFHGPFEIVKWIPEHWISLTDSMQKQQLSMQKILVSAISFHLQLLNTSARWLSQAFSEYTQNSCQSFVIIR